MPALPGHKKAGGRQKGTPNKITGELAERIRASDKDPVDVMIELLRDDNKLLRLQAAKELMQYLYPKRKALEFSNTDDKGFKVVIEDYTTQK